VGGEFSQTPWAYPPGGHIAIHQMYVQYMIPQGGDQNVPVVMVHGASLSGKTYETTPDGRMGWDEYFVRQGHASYLADQVSPRSGFNPSIFNQVRAGIVPPSSQAGMFQFTNELAWTIFRFGPTVGIPFADKQFPVQAADKLAKQEVPDLNGILPTPNPTWKALGSRHKLEGSGASGPL
jgi:hypothetical protein